MAELFISYRRSDSFPYANQIGEKLRAAFGEGAVFLDLKSIEAGEDFPAAIVQTIQRCRVVLVLIGRSWAVSADGEGNRRLDDPADWVRKEILTASAVVPHIIPVLVAGAAMPGSEDLPEALRFLAVKNAVDVRDSHFDQDCEELAAKIEQVSKLKRRSRGRPLWRTIVGAYPMRSPANAMLRTAFGLSALGFLILLTGGAAGEYPRVVLVFAALIVVTRAADLYID